MKIPFDIKYRPQIESGEYKVETRDGRPVKIISFEMTDTNGCPIAAQFRLCAGTPVVYLFDKEGYYKGEGDSDYDLFLITPEHELTEFEECIFKLLRQYKECDIPLTPENIKAEASMLWQDFEKYFFILYGKGGEGDSALRNFYYRGLADGKAETLKDLPKWKVSNAMRSTLPTIMYGENGMILYKDGFEISISDLEKLPKED